VQRTLLQRVHPSLPVYTCNPDDFSGIDGLTVIPVPVPPTPGTPERTTTS
jgi:hypothetical protein